MKKIIVAVVAVVILLVTTCSVQRSNELEGLPSGNIQKAIVTQQ